MKPVFTLFSLLILTLVSSNGCSASDAKTAEYQNQIDAIKAMQNKAVVPKDKADIPELKASVNVNDYFHILKHITLEKEWTLDYIYWGDGLGSFPIIFASKGGEDPDFLDKFKKNHRLSAEYLNHIKTDGTEDSFLQFVLLNMIGNQFALGWHANYHDAIITCTKDAVARVLGKRNDNFYRFDEDFMNKAREIDPSPAVTFNGDDVAVRLVYFTSWGGFVEAIYHVTRSYPHKIVKTDKKELVPFHCRIVF